MRACIVNTTVPPLRHLALTARTLAHATPVGAGAWPIRPAHARRDTQAPIASVIGPSLETPPTARMRAHATPAGARARPIRPAHARRGMLAGIVNMTVPPQRHLALIARTRAHATPAGVRAWPIRPAHATRDTQGPIASAMRQSLQTPPTAPTRAYATPAGARAWPIRPAHARTDATVTTARCVSLGQDCSSPVSVSAMARISTPCNLASCTPPTSSHAPAAHMRRRGMPLQPGSWSSTAGRMELRLRCGMGRSGLCGACGQILQH